MEGREEGRKEKERRKEEKERKKTRKKGREWGKEGEGGVGRKQDPTCTKPDWLCSQGAHISRRVVP